VIEARRIADRRRWTQVLTPPALTRFDRSAHSLADSDGLLAGSAR
jgi:hypothetical protein